MLSKYLLDLHMALWKGSEWLAVDINLQRAQMKEKDLQLQVLLEGWSGQSEEIWNYEFATRFGNCNLGLLRSFRTLRAQISKLARSL